MKLRNLLLAGLALFAFVSCNDDESAPSDPVISLNPTELVFDSAAGSKTVTLASTRDWTVEKADKLPAWLKLSKTSGKAADKSTELDVTVLPNTGANREYEVIFSIGLMKGSLTVKQNGQTGSAEDAVIYANDFDKAVAEKTYGSSNNSYPYLDQFDGWKNESGSGAAGVKYEFKAMSVRSNSNSDGTHSKYAGSGKNNLFFGNAAYFVVEEIALPEGKSDFNLSFGVDKYQQGAENVVKFGEEFHVYISNDGAKYVELKDFTFATGSAPDGDWDLVSQTVSFSGASKLYIRFSADVASAFRIDDLKLELSGISGTAIDFSKGVDLGGGSGSGSGDVPSNIKEVTVAEFIAAPESNDQWYRLTGKVKGPINTTYGNFDLVDETGSVYVYGLTKTFTNGANDQSFAQIGIKEGDVVTIVGIRGSYGEKVEVMKAYYEKHEAGTEPDPDPTPVEIVNATVVEVLAAEDSETKLYRVTGTVKNIVNTTYGNFDLEDETGKIFVYGLKKAADADVKSFAEIGLKEGDIVTLVGPRISYNATPQIKSAYYEKHVPGEGGSTGGDQGPVEENEFSSNVTWTLGANAYDNTSTGNNKQSVNVTYNGTTTNDVIALKIGVGKAAGEATLHIPAGTKSVSFWALAWNAKPTKLSVQVGGQEVYVKDIAVNAGVNNNAPYNVTIADTDHYTFDVTSMPGCENGLPQDMDVKVTTPAGAANYRIVFFGIKAEK